MRASHSWAEAKPRQAKVSGESLTRTKWCVPFAELEALPAAVAALLLLLLWPVVAAGMLPICDAAQSVVRHKSPAGHFTVMDSPQSSVRRPAAKNKEAPPTARNQSPYPTKERS